MTTVTDFDWTVDIDQHGELNSQGQPTLILFLIDEENGWAVDAIGGVDVNYWVSDHGNIHIDRNDEIHIGLLVKGMIERIQKGA